MDDMTEDDVRRILASADTLSTPAHHRLMSMAGSVHPCQVDGGCNLSQEEHHRLAYGLIAEHREMRRRLTALENGRAPESDVA